MTERIKLADTKRDIEQAFEWWLACTNDLGVTEAAQARVNAFLAQIEEERIQAGIARAACHALLAATSDNGGINRYGLEAARDLARKAVGGHEAVKN